MRMQGYTTMNNKTNCHKCPRLVKSLGFAIRHDFNKVINQSIHQSITEDNSGLLVSWIYTRQTDAHAFLQFK